MSSKVKVLPKGVKIGDTMIFLGGRTRYSTSSLAVRGNEGVVRNYDPLDKCLLIQWIDGEHPEWVDAKLFQKR